MKILKKEWLQILVLIIPFGFAAWAWNQLPDRMPIHWGINGQADGYSSKTLAALLTPCINLAICLLVMIMPRFDPKFARYDEETQASLLRTFKVMRIAITLFLTVVALAILATPLYPAMQVPTILMPGVGLLLIVFGNLMSKLRPNWFFGIRTPWTLESRDVWMKTHRLGGRLMMLGGACMLVFGLLLPVKIFVLGVLLPAVAVMSIVPIVYSYVVCSRLRLMK